MVSGLFGFLLIVSKSLVQPLTVIATAAIISSSSRVIVVFIRNISLVLTVRVLVFLKGGAEFYTIGTGSWQRPVAYALLETIAIYAQCSFRIVAKVVCGPGIKVA